MATSEISVNKIVSSREETRPNVHLRVEVETETGPLVINLSPAAAHQLQDIFEKTAAKRLISVATQENLDDPLQRQSQRQGGPHLCRTASNAAHRLRRGLPNRK